MEILSFIRNHWQLLVEVVLMLASLVLIIVKKQVKINDTFTGLLKVLPDYIRDAEKIGANGQVKFTLVFTNCVNYLITATGLSSKEICDKYADAINSAIENILTTPQKKEAIKCQEKN